MPDKLTDNEIVKACKDCLHYEACKGTYSSAKGEENILYDFDGEMYANSGCEDFEDKNLINRLQAENERLKGYQKDGFFNLLGNCLVFSKTLKDFNDMRKGLKAEAYKEFAERLKNKIINDTAYACDCTQHSGYYDYKIKIGDIPEYIDEIVKEMAGE